MLNLQLARKYSAAIFELAQEENKLEAYGQELAEISQNMFSSPEVVAFFANPQVQPEEKKAVLQKIFAKEKISANIMNFMLLLVDKRRFVLLEAINDVYQELANKAQGIIIADVTTAFDLKPALAVKLGNKLTAVSGRKVKLRTHLNKDIIGGIIVKIGDNRIDGSVTGRLQSLKAELIAKTH